MRRELNKTVKIFIIPILLMINTSCINLSGDQTPTQAKKKSSKLPPTFSNAPQKRIIDLRTHINIDFKSDIKDSSHVVIKTTYGKILFSGAVFSLKSKNRVTLPYNQSALLVSIGNTNNQKLFPIKNKSILIGAF